MGNLMKKNLQKKSPPKYADFVYGVHAALELLTAKRRKISTVYTTKHVIKAWPKISKLLPAHIPVQFVARESLDNITQNAQHQGIVIFVSPFPFFVEQQVLFLFLDLIDMKK